jgi:Holliday junction resolvase RusA-like endonuclease
MPRFNTPVHILIHSFRHRLVDPDNICAKGVIDAIVRAGLLADDTTEQISEVRYKQTKIGTKEKEKTEVTITADKETA